MQAVVYDTRKDVKMNRITWEYGYDATVVYVNRYYYTRFFKRLRKQRLALFFTRDFIDAEQEAKDYIERITA